jgi:aminoglycoside phosphotransferase family enzyme
MDRDSSASQAEVIAFLASAEAHGGERPEHIETHLSHLFLTGARVFKLRKALCWSMVDYASVEAREHFSRREVELNSRTAPGLYVGVRTITRADGHLAFDGPGVVVDHLVEMRRFDRADELDVLVDEGRLTGPMADATADAIAALHRGAPRIRNREGARRVAAVTDQLARDLLSALPAERSAIARWSTLARAEADRLGPFLLSRGRHGFVRRCHGDLHLSNICIWEAKPTPFDAIEFSEEVATIDVVYDLAFVLVDLELRKASALGLRLLSRWLETTRDYSGLALLPLFRSQRAMVRALVSTTKGRDPLPALSLALEALEERAPVRLVAVGGLSGSGKTTVARGLAAQLGAPLIRSDIVRKRMAHVPPTARLPASQYRAGSGEAVYRRMRCDARRALAARSPVILDATFIDPAERENARRLAASVAVPFAGLWLDAPLETRLARVASRTGDASDAAEAVVRAQAAEAALPVGWTIVPAGGSEAETIDAALAAIAPQR